MQLRRSERAASPAPTTFPIWTQLTGKSSLPSLPPASNASSCPAARSGHAMTFLLPTSSVLLFGGADGKIFLEDVFVLEPAGYEGSSSKSGRMTTRSSRREGEEAAEQVTEDLKWKKLVVSHGSAFNAESPSPMFSSAPSNSASPRAIGSGVERRAPTFLHPGGGRDYHTMHYVQSSSEEENSRGTRVLVLGNVVVASTEVAMQRGAGTQAEGGVGNDTMAFDGPTLRVEELRVRQPMLEAQWEARRVDHASMWKPRARHAHSSVVVGGDQVFVFGGKDAASTTFFNDIFYYDAPLNHWVKPSVSPTGQPPQPRAFAGLTASDDGNTLFLFGGTDGRQEFGSLFLFDVMHFRWDSLVSATLGERPSCRINHSLTFAAPNHLVLFGGRRRSLRQNDLYIFNVDTRTWRLVPGGQTEEPRNGNRSSQMDIDGKAPVGRTAHATVLYHAEPTGPNAVQKLLIFGGYAGSHQWLDDLYLLSLPQAVLMQSPPTSRSSSRSIAATQRTQPTRFSLRKAGTDARVALSAPHQPLQPQSSQSTQQKESVHPLALLDQSALPAKEPQLPLQQQQQQTFQTVEPEHEPSQINAEQPQSHSQSSTRATSAGSTQRQPPPTESLRSDTAQRAPCITGSGVLTDITNQPGASSPKQEAVVSRAVGARSDTTLRDPKKKYKRRRLADDSQDSNNSNSTSSNGSGELTTAQVGIQTTLMQLLRHQPRVENVLTRILSMLTNEQTARQQQSMNQETLMRVHSEEQSKLLEAATRRNEALDGRLARSEAERASLHEKLMARETELYMHKHSLEAAIPPLNERVQSIEASHLQQLNISRVIESKISAVHDFMDELRHAGGEGTEVDDSPNRHIGRLDDSVATQPTPSPPKPLLYPQRVVLALEEKIRVMQSENDALEAQVSTTVLLHFFFTRFIYCRAYLELCCLCSSKRWRRS
ncbi:hypothetical protein V7S43_014613 [Phytophthora oleae]|uniref:Uncharacterized protein n=1 Tax=Phytophthora oleae TaxID=2107226 RepID=A0ABD3F0Y2_9STRA